MTNKKISEAQLREAYEKGIQTYLHRTNITGIDIGYKYVNGKRMATETIRFHVQEKVPVSQLEAVELFPNEINGIPTDVIQAIYKPQMELRTAIERQRHLDYIQPGVSVGHPNISAGTLGAIVYDNLTGAPCILSNWHILAGSDSAQVGDAILQPGKVDGGRSPQDRIAELKRFFLNQDGDAAIAELNGKRPVLRLQYGTKAIIQSARQVQRGEILVKSGRTTGVTRGRVDGVGRYKISYGSVGEHLIDGFKLVPIQSGNPNNDEVSSGGDSGSLWYDPDSLKGVGLHFAGETNTSPTAEHGIACHLPDVLTALDVSLLPLCVNTNAHNGSSSSSQLSNLVAEGLPTRAEMGDITNEELSQSPVEANPSVNWNPSPHYFSRSGYHPEAIVIHIAEGSFAAIGHWFKNPASKVSAHYGISKEGEIDQYVQEDQAAWHAGAVLRPSWRLLKAGVNPNLYTIGIEHAGYANEVWSGAMYRTSADLVQQLAHRYGIPFDRDHIIGHREIYANKSCPGYQVDLDKLIALARDGEIDTIRFYVVQRGDTLFRIANQFGTSVSILKQLNPEILNVDVIYVGQKINLP